jgi:hypothetical protein
MASAKPKGGLTKWFKEEWVDIGRKKKGGGHAPCGRKKASTKKKVILNVSLSLKRLA